MRRRKRRRRGGGRGTERGGVKGYRGKGRRRKESGSCHVTYE
jgi:hypothetical protein